MSNILVTGASGFVGRHLCETLVSNGYSVTGTTRTITGRITEYYKTEAVGDIGAEIDWRPYLEDIDTAIHLAARVHIVSDDAVDPLSAFRHVNVRGTERLAEQAAAAGVQRFIYVSTIKVLGEKTDGRPFHESDSENPRDPYAVSKQEAEAALDHIGRSSDMEVVVLRPPLVYGPGVGGNFLRLLSLVDRRFPLPFGSIENRRTMLSIFNLCDAIRLCVSNPNAVGRKLLLGDDEDVSTAGLCRIMAKHMGRPIRLLPIPASCLRFGARMIGRSAEVSRLCDSLQINIEPTKKALGWQPAQSLEDGVRSVTRWYLDSMRQNRA